MKKHETILETFSRLFGRKRVENVFQYLFETDFFYPESRNGGDFWQAGNLAGFLYFVSIADDDGSIESVQRGFRPTTQKLIMALARRLRHINPDQSEATHLRALRSVKIYFLGIVFDFQTQSEFTGDASGDMLIEISAADFREIFLLQF